jgi:hypothetical protein
VFTATIDRSLLMCLTELASKPNLGWKGDTPEDPFLMTVNGPGISQDLTRPGRLWIVLAGQVSFGEQKHNVGSVFGIGEAFSEEPAVVRADQVKLDEKTSVLGVLPVFLANLLGRPDLTEENRAATFSFLQGIVKQVRTNLLAEKTRRSNFSRTFAALRLNHLSCATENLALRMNNAEYHALMAHPMKVILDSMEEISRAVKELSSRLESVDNKAEGMIKDMGELKKQDASQQQDQ